MKLYVWEGVLTDWTPGMIVAIATNKQEAIELVKKGRASDTRMISDMRTVKPTIVNLGPQKHRPRIWYVSGGG